MFFRLLVLLFFFFPVCAQKKLKTDVSQTNFSQDRASVWADSVLHTLSESEKIGQLFMIPAYSNKDSKYEAALLADIKDYAVGGVIFMQGGPVRQALLTNQIQSQARLPLLISTDAEWGLGMRLKDSTISFPKQMVLGALPSDSLVYEMGQRIAAHCRRLGIHVNFAPVVDINSNPANPVIGVRSFGEDKRKVAQWGIAYAKGLQDGGIIASAKHFPGHGDTDKDSHLTLPKLSHSRERLDSIELYPFKKLIQQGVMSVMAGHLFIPAYDSTPNQASSLSTVFIKNLLQDSLGFKGIVFTDALDMKGVSQHYASGDANVAALLAGNTVLLFPGNLPSAKSAIEKALADGRISLHDIEQKVKLILKAKYFAGLNQYKPIKLQNLYAELNDPNSKALKRKIYAQAITVVKADSSALPIRSVHTKKIVALGVGAGAKDEFLKRLQSYAPLSATSLTKAEFVQKYELLSQKADWVVVGLQSVGNSEANAYDLPANLRNALDKLNAQKKLILVLFGNPYALKYFDGYHNLICAYDNSAEAQDIAAQIVFGAIPAKGRLPVGVGKLELGAGRDLGALGRLKFGLPEQVGIASPKLDRIDSLARQIVETKAAPGCQILVCKQGMVVYEKAFGFLDYQNIDSVTLQTRYDIASVSKVVGTLQAAMMLHSQNKFDLKAKLSDYLPQAQNTNKAEIQMEDMLSHQAGLMAFIPLYDLLFERGKLDSNFLSRTRKENFEIEVCENLFAKNDIHDWILQKALDSRLTKYRNKYGKVGYLYSDLGFFFLQKIIETITAERLDLFLKEKLFAPLGLTSMTYNPLQSSDCEGIAPSEYDLTYRKQIIRGYVHDPMASLQRGVGGHAGIFSNALDVAVVLQMNLQGGHYGGEFFFAPQTFQLFNTRPNPKNDNRRAIGWDKPLMPNQSGDGPTSELCPQSVFGHTGFTGTCAWADPDNEMIYVFLSNRTFPTALNRKLSRESYRTLIQDCIYQALR
jgi:beta-glucosidase-like glycosyl hydrolase/CubicO group peptidase (beta-lactamase class C family)